MTSVWKAGRGFVKTTAQRGVKTFNAGPGAFASKHPSAAKSPGTLSRGPGQSQNPDDDIRAFRQWQNSKGGWGAIGTGKYWKDADDAAKSLGGIGVDFDRSQYHLRDIRPRSTGKKMGGKDRTPEKKSATDPEGVDLKPPEDPEGERERLGLRPGGQPYGELGPAGRRHGLTDVGYPGMAGEELEGQKALPRGPGVTNFQPQLGAGEPDATGGRSHTLTDVSQGDGQGLGDSVFGEIGKGQFPEMGRGRNVIEADARDAAPMGELEAPATVGRTKDTARMGAYPASKTPSRLGKGINTDVGPGSPHTAAYMAGDPSPLRGPVEEAQPGAFDFSSTAEPLYQPKRNMGRGR